MNPTQCHLRMWAFRIQFDKKNSNAKNKPKGLIASVADCSAYNVISVANAQMSFTKLTTYSSALMIFHVIHSSKLKCTLVRYVYEKVCSSFLNNNTDYFST